MLIIYQHYPILINFLLLEVQEAFFKIMIIYLSVHNLLKYIFHNQNDSKLNNYANPL